MFKEIFPAPQPAEENIPVLEPIAETATKEEFGVLAPSIQSLLDSCDTEELSELVLATVRAAHENGCLDEAVSELAGAAKEVRLGEPGLTDQEKKTGEVTFGGKIMKITNEIIGVKQRKAA